VLRAAARQALRGLGLILEASTTSEINMPIILWLLGVPLSIVLLLMLFGVF
jgi:hypothetical protein